jgi:PD-(D/E)XK endonuclease
MGWFSLRGWVCSLPSEPCAYDLIVDIGGVLKRVQVKSFTRRDGEGRPWGKIAHSHLRDTAVPSIPYSPDEVDLFFIIDGDLEVYVIPLDATTGRVSISLHMFSECRVGSAAGLM